MSSPRMYAVIMAGGRGTRFWPASREIRPKQFLTMTGEQSLLQQTLARILPLAPPKNILVVTGESCRQETCRQLPQLPEENIIAEPMGRNTAPCIGLAALFIAQQNPEAVMLTLPADHLVSDEEAFRETLRHAAAAAAEESCLVTIGIAPHSPETGFGYIERGEALNSDSGKNLFRVSSFREKPDLEQARTFLERGTFYWNSGIFLWKVSVIMDAIETFLPDLRQKLADLAPHLGTPGEAEAIRAAYEGIKPVSIDFGVMEKAGNVLLTTGNFGWSDLGSWDALADLATKDGDGNSLQGPVIALDTARSLVMSGGRLIALVGVDDLVVVERDDAILVMKRGRSQDVKLVVDRLEGSGMKDYL